MKINSISEWIPFPSADKQIFLSWVGCGIFVVVVHSSYFIGGVSRVETAYLQGLGVEFEVLVDVAELVVNLGRQVDVVPCPPRGFLEHQDCLQAESEKPND